MYTRIELLEELSALLAAGLAGKEHSNPQFMFLKPTHSMFGFFTSLCDAYSRVLMPDKGLMQKLQKDADDRQGLHMHPIMLVTMHLHAPLSRNTSWLP